MRAHLAARHEVVYTRAFPHFAVEERDRVTARARGFDLAWRVVSSAQRRLRLSRSYDFDFYTRAYGRLAAPHVEGCDVTIAFSFVAREPHRRARVRVLELPATHVAAHLALGGGGGNVRFSRFAVARAEAEYAQADVIDVLSSWARRTLVERGVPPEKIVVTPLGVDPARFAVGAPAARPFRVLCVGRIERAKGIAPLVAALGKLRAAELLLVGAVQDDARALVSAPNVTVRAPVSPEALAALYREADVLAFPSLSDGFGLVILEAMASGLPVVASDHSAGPDVIRDGQDGFVVPAGDAGALAERLAWLQDRPEARVELGRSARARVEAEFTEARYAERLEQLIAAASRRDRARSAAAPRESAARPSPR
jgi:glycosyltransferase involved in cell wall biosynthesis